jgi:sugar phosphate isomerase/epimerase
MKYAFMTFSCPEATWEQVLDYAKQYGYDAVEPRVDSKHKHGVEPDADAQTLAAKRKEAEDAGIAISCIATSCSYADPQKRGEQVEHTRKCIDLAATMGANRLRVFGGLIPTDISRDDATSGIASALQSVADHAADKGVIVCLETHDDWCNPGHVAKLMETVGHDHIAVNWDIMHPVTRGLSSMKDAYKTLKPWVKYVHFHDGKWEDGKIHICAIGEGIVDHAVALSVLAEDGYDGYLSGEWISWEPAEEHLPREINAIRKLEGQIAVK